MGISSRRTAPETRVDPDSISSSTYLGSDTATSYGWVSRQPDDEDEPFANDADPYKPIDKLFH